MKLLSAIARELLGLFVDDGGFALSILIVVWAAAFATLLALPSPYVGLLLVTGLAAVLGESVWHDLRR
jgi:fatty acid desaturase